MRGRRSEPSSNTHEGARLLKHALLPSRSSSCSRATTRRRPPRRRRRSRRRSPRPPIRAADGRRTIREALGRLSRRVPPSRAGSGDVARHARLRRHVAGSSIAGDADNHAYYERVRIELVRISPLELSEAPARRRDLGERVRPVDVLARRDAHDGDERARLRAPHRRRLRPALTRSFAPAADRAKSSRRVSRRSARSSPPPARDWGTRTHRDRDGHQAEQRAPRARRRRLHRDPRRGARSARRRLAAAKQASTALHDLQKFLEGECLTHSDAIFASVERS